MDLFLDVFIAGFGLYLIYAAVNMKRTGELAKGIMVSRDADLSKAKDIPGFIRYMYGKTIAIGACSAVCGAVGVFGDTHGGLGILQPVMTIAVFFVIVIFGVLTVKAQKRYLGL